MAFTIDIVHLKNARFQISSTMDYLQILMIIKYSNSKLFFLGKFLKHYLVSLCGQTSISFRQNAFHSQEKRSFNFYGLWRYWLLLKLVLRYVRIMMVRMMVKIRCHMIWWTWKCNENFQSIQTLYCWIIRTTPFKPLWWSFGGFKPPWWSFGMNVLPWLLLSVAELNWVGFVLLGSFWSKALDG